MNFPIEYAKKSPEERAKIRKMIEKHLLSLNAYDFPKTIGYVSGDSVRIKEVIDIVIYRMFENKETDIQSIFQYLENIREY